ncbi:MAG: glycosyl transferase [Rudanella sp.]|nr:glycosyl transferase [Rudanella sp.]
MPLAFTICSVNYLAQARTLGDSLRATNPDWTYVIGLVDDLNSANLPADLMPPYTMIEVAAIGIPDFEAMCARYDITELNTAVKPFFIDYFYTVHPEYKKVVYFDPDIIVFQPLTRLENHLDEYSLVLTPHTCSPTPDWERPNEQHHLGTGIFNLGFIGLQANDEAKRFVNWWKERLVYECQIDLCAGLFVDQHWVNFAPTYFDNVWIEKHRGYNVAYWNLHERFFSQHQGKWMVNGDEPLQFFHYSGYSPYKPFEVSKYQTRYTFADTTQAGESGVRTTDRTDVWPLFELYKERLLTNGNDRYRKYPCVYIKLPTVLRYKRIRNVLTKPIHKLIAFLEERSSL